MKFFIWIELANLTFNSEGIGTGHAIYITQAGEYDFNDFSYNNYGATGTTDAVVYNNSGGDVSIYVLGGDLPTYRNGVSSTTNIVVSISLTLNSIIENSEVTIVRTSDREILYNVENVGPSGSVTYSYGTAEAGETVDILVFNIQYEAYALEYILGGSDSTIPITQRFDRVYSNP